jgi:hypothetical protein
MRARAGAYGGGDQALESTRGCGVFGPGVQPVGKLGKVPELRTWPEAEEGETVPGARFFIIACLTPFSPLFLRQHHNM